MMDETVDVIDDLFDNLENQIGLIDQNRLRIGEDFSYLAGIAVESEERGYESFP